VLIKFKLWKKETYKQCTDKSSNTEHRYKSTPYFHLSNNTPNDCLSACSSMYWIGEYTLKPNTHGKTPARFPANPE